MTQQINQENMQAIYHIGHEPLFDGYLIEVALSIINTLNINLFLFYGYLIKAKFPEKK